MIVVNGSFVLNFLICKSLKNIFFALIIFLIATNMTPKSKVAIIIAGICVSVDMYIFGLIK